MSGVVLDRVRHLVARVKWLVQEERVPFPDKIQAFFADTQAMITLVAIAVIAWSLIGYVKDWLNPKKKEEKEREKERIVTTIGDTAEIQATLDQHAEDAVAALGHSVDHFVMDRVIVGGFICTALGALSHFYPLPFPQSRPMIAFCVFGYYAVQGYLLYIEKTVEQGFFLRTSCKDAKFRFKSSIEKYGTNYTLEIQTTRGNSGKWVDAAKGTGSAEDWFDEDGVFAAPVFEGFLKGLVNKAQSLKD